MLLAPPRLKFGWDEIAQRGMGPPMHIYIAQEAADLMTCTMIVQILGQVNLLLVVVVAPGVGQALQPVSGPKCPDQADVLIDSSKTHLGLPWGVGRTLWRTLTAGVSMRMGARRRF